MKRIMVEIKLIVPVEVEDDYYNDDFTPEFDIEESHCPGTGVVWLALSKIIEEHDKNNTCWACALEGKNKIISSQTL